MKIELTKELKIKLLKSIKDGVLNTNDIPELINKFKDINPFLELMKEVTSRVEFTGEDIVEIDKDVSIIMMKTILKERGISLTPEIVNKILDNIKLTTII